jgi:hypothetical protein
VYLAWTVGEDASADIRLARSDDHGQSFSDPTIISRTPGYSDAPKIAIDRKGTLHLVHAESAAGPFDRYHVAYTRSKDQGRTFEAARNLSAHQPRDTASAAFPALGVDGTNRLFVLSELYDDHRQRPRGLALTTSGDGGNSFSSPAMVPDSRDPSGGVNGSLQGLLVRKLAVGDNGSIAMVNSSFKANVASRVWLMRGSFSGAEKRC